MIARHRGEHHQRGVWQPHRGDSRAEPAATPSENTQAARHNAAEAALETTSAAPAELAVKRPRTRHCAWGKTLALLLAGMAGFAAHQIIIGKPRPTTLAATPKQWVSAYEAAAIDNPQRVCTKLFAPQLTAAYAGAAHRGCTSYFTRIKATSVRVRQILQDGATAIVELHQTIEGTNWDVVLARHYNGWRAIDIIPGRPLL